MSPDQSDDIQLLAQVASGHENALKTFYQRHEPMVYRFALTRLGEPSDAADVVNDVMLQVWRGAENFAGRSRVTTWLLGIANHKVLDILRRRGRSETDELDDNAQYGDLHDTEHSIFIEQQLTHIQQCLDNLSPLQKSVLELTFIDELSYPEIAQVLDCPHGTVKTRIFHARKILRRCLEKLTAKP